MTNIQEISKPVEQVVTDEMQSMTAILGGFFMMHLKGKSTGCDTQVNQASAVETSRSVAEQAKEIVGQCSDIVSNCEGTSNSRGSVESPLATPGQGNSKDSISK